MIENDFLRVLLSNAIALVNLALLIYSAVLDSKKHLVRTRDISMALMILVYLVSNCWSSVIVNIFSIGRDHYCMQSRKKSRAVIALILAAGTLLTVLVNSSTNASNLALLPVISFLVYSIGLFASKTANQLKLINALDVSLWVLYDYKNMLVMCVVQDIFIILMSLAAQYVRLDSESCSKSERST